MKGKVLVVVDMQPGYRPDMNTAQVGAVQSLIRMARHEECVIIFLEFLDARTLWELLELVQRYDQVTRRVKRDTDGSPEVIEICGSYLLLDSLDLDLDDEEKPEPRKYDEFVVCGVNTNCCVRDTATGLACKLFNSRVEVVKEACGSREGNSWDKFPQLPNLQLVSLA